jgi:hypothetical protein
VRFTTYASSQATTRRILIRTTGSSSARAQYPDFYQAGVEQGGYELEVLRSAGDQLGQHQVVPFKAQPRGTVRSRRREAHQPVLPAVRRRGCVHVHALRVVAVHLVEVRVLAQDAIDCVRLDQARVVGEEDVCLDRGVRRLRQVVFVEGPEDGSATDHDHLAVVGDARRCTQDVRELLAGHETRRF